MATTAKSYFVDASPVARANDLDIFALEQFFYIRRRENVCHFGGSQGLIYYLFLCEI